MFWHNILTWIKRIIKRVVRLILNKNKNFESMKLYKNIDVVQINIKAGVSEYFFPRNVDWADKVIEKMIVYAPAQESGILSPIDLKNYIMDREDYTDIYIDLYGEDNTELAFSLSAQSIVHNNNYPLEINSKISLQLSRIFFTTPPSDGCLLIYVFWGNREVEDMDLPQNSVTVDVEVPFGKDVMFDEFIDTYIHAQGKKVKGIDVWGGFHGIQDVFVTLRDHNYNTIIKLLPTAMCRPQVIISDDAQAENVQVHPMYLDNADIDFANSYLRASGDSMNTQTVTITLYY